jgi:hypothetical protein
MRILSPPAHGDENKSSLEPYIGVEASGLQSSEALLLARYFMFSQVYFHPVRRIYDIHLKDFLAEWLSGGCYPNDTEQFFAYTDAEITSAMRQAAKDTQIAGHVHAKRIIDRNHFRVLHEGTLSDMLASGGAMKAKHIAAAAAKEFGADKIRFDSSLPKDSTIDFPVRERDGSIVSAHSKSQVLKKIPAAAFEYIFVEKEILPKVSEWYKNNKTMLMAESIEEES